ncbi:MAG TPA: hypothetical protein PKW50_02205 [Syntrophomonas sp.]|nr:hypothetical protein [Syntrophomonas sp.]
MMKKTSIVLLLVFLLAALSITGCKLNIQQLWQKTQPAEPELLNVEMHFTNGDVVYGYVKSMGIADEGEVYNGGSSINYFYDQQGKIIGSFNYSRLEYMKLIP